MRILLLITPVLFALNSQAQSADSVEIRKIMKQAEFFSAAYVAGDYDKMVGVYTRDGKIMPPGAPIIEGHEAIRQRWVLPEGVHVTRHKSTPVEVILTGDDKAYDAGYYEGTTRRADGSLVNWKGKYVIIWKKEDGQWKMLYDIWNRVE